MQTCWRNVRRYCLKTGLSLTTTYETSGKVKFPKPILVLIRRLHEHDGQHHDGGFSCRQSFDHAGDAHLGLKQVGAMVQVENHPVDPFAFWLRSSNAVCDPGRFLHRLCASTPVRVL
jgi:hypothetical protein